MSEQALAPGGVSGGVVVAGQWGVVQSRVHGSSGMAWVKAEESRQMETR